MAYIPTKSDVSPPQSEIDQPYSPTQADADSIMAEQNPSDAEGPMTLSEHARNIGAGLLSGAYFPAKYLVAKPLEAAGLLPDYMKGFSPYSALGVEEKPFSTTAGKEQAISEIIAPGGASAKPIIKTAQFFRKIDPVKLIKKIQSAHDLKMAENSEIYEDVKKGAKALGLDYIKIDPKIIDSVKRHLPDTQRVRDLISRAKTGSYDALHDIQSYFGKKGTKWIKSGDVANERAGEEMLDARNIINDAIENHFDSSGMNGLADRLREARSGWRSLKKTYYDYNPIKRIVHEDIRKVPKNPWGILTEDSAPIKQLMRENPEIDRDVALYIFRNKLKDNRAISGALKYGVKGAGYGLAGALAGLGFEGVRRGTKSYLNDGES